MKRLERRYQLGAGPVTPDIVKPVDKPITIETIPIDKDDEAKQYPVLGAHWLPNLYICADLIGKSGSGKTTAIYNFIKNTCGPGTTVLLFCKTWQNDKSWLAIQKLCQERGIAFIANDSIYERDDNGKRIGNHLQKWIKGLKEQAKHDKALRKEESKVGQFRRGFPIGGGWIINEDTPKTFCPTIDQHLVGIDGVEYEYAPWMVIMDDLPATEMHSHWVGELVRTNRHWKCKLIMSSQYHLDIPPDARSNIRRYYLFKDLEPKQLEIVRQAYDPKLPFEKFIMRYQDATSPERGFLIVDRDLHKMMNSRNESYEDATV